MAIIAMYPPMQNLAFFISVVKSQNQIHKGAPELVHQYGAGPTFGL